MKPPYWLLLGLSVLFFIGTTAFWIFKNNLPPAWDQANYLEASEALRQTLAGEGVLGFLAKTTTILGSKAPLVAILPIPLYLIFGSTPHVALMINMVFAGLFFVFFYKLVALIFDHKIALTSMVIVSTMPLFYGLGRYFFVEFGLMTLVVIWMYLILKTENLTNRKYLFLLGLVSGLGMLMKFHFFIFMVGPAFIVFYSSWKKFGRRLFDFGNLFVFSMPAISIALPWYARNILTVLWKAKRSANPEFLGNLYYGPPFSIQNLYQSGLDFINYAISAYWFLLLLILGAVFIYKQSFSANKKRGVVINYFLLSWFLIPFLIFYLGPNKDYRLMLPLLPPVAIFTAWLLNQALVKKQLLALMILASFPVLIFANTSVLGTKLIKNKISLGPLVFSDKKIGDYVQAPRSESWPIIEMLTYLAKNNETDGPRVVILASEDEIFNINTLRYYLTREKLSLIIKSASYFPEGTDYQIIEGVINQGDYLIMKTGGISGPDNLNRFNGLILQNLDYQKWEELPHNIRLSDGGKINIWKKS